MAAHGVVLGVGSRMAALLADVPAPGVTGLDSGKAFAVANGRSGRPVAVDTANGRASAFVLSLAAVTMADEDIGVRVRSTDTPVHASTASTMALANSIAVAVLPSGSRTSA